MFRVSPILKCSCQTTRQIWVLRSSSGCCEKFRKPIKVSFLFSAFQANHSMNILRKFRRWLSTTRSILLILALETLKLPLAIVLPGSSCQTEACHLLIPAFQSDLLSLTWFNKYISDKSILQIYLPECLNNISTRFINKMLISIFSIFIVLR